MWDDFKWNLNGDVIQLKSKTFHMKNREDWNAFLNGFVDKDDIICLF